MKETGIIRRIDELGRIVVPKEIRKTYKLREGSQVEIFTDEDKLILKKFSPLVDLEDIAEDACASIFESLEECVFVCDKDKVIACQGLNKKNMQNKSITLELECVIEQRKPVLLNSQENSVLIPLLKDFEYQYSSEIIVPISSSGDTYGAICVIGKDTLSTHNVKAIQTFANFISKQIL